MRFAPQVSASSRAAEARGLGYRVNREIPEVGWTVIETVPGRSGQALMDELLNSPLVEAIEFDVPVTLAATPNDPLYAGQWGFENTGQTGGTSGADVSAEAAWDITTGSSAIVVAVTDTGVNLEHPDLVGNAWVNPGEIAGNGVDDDANGYIDDMNGWDFANNDATVFDAADSDRHGTHVAGTIGAVTDNGVGVSGMNWDVSIMSCKFLTPIHSSLSDGIAALIYAVDNGADVINNSWSASASTTALYDAIVYAADHGVVCVAAAANGGSDGIGDDIDVTPAYPASYNTTNVVTVAATDHNDALASFSNYGLESVDLAAPGVDVTSTIPSTSAALHVVESPFEVMYFGFPIESIMNTTDRSAVFAGAMTELDPAGDGSVLVVDDSYPTLTQDGVGARLSVYESELVAAGYTSITTWDVEAAGMPTLAQLGTGPVVWFTGGLSYYYYNELSLDSADRTLLGNYLDGGGNLLLSGGGIGEDLEDNYFGFDVTWYRNYLHAICTDYYSWTGDIEGTVGGLYDSLISSVDPYDTFGWSWPAGTDNLIAYDGMATPMIEWASYAPADGTSMASPHVAGAIALVMSMRPGMTAHEAQVRIQTTVDPIASLADKVVTGGRMNVAAAMTDYPFAPTAISATPGVDGDMAISWTDPTHVGQLATRLVRAIGAWPTGPDDGVTVYEGTAEAATDTGLPHGADVRYSAYALDMWGNWSAAATESVVAVDTTAPDDPGTFTASAVDADVQLGWTNPSAADFAGVRVLARLDTTPTGPGDASARLVYEGTGTAWLDQDVLPASQETTIFYAAYAFDGNPNYSSGVADSVAVDYAPPPGTFVIDEDAASTADPVVSLDSSVSGATLMRFDMGGGFGDWIAYADSSLGTFVGADGLRTVTAQYKDAADNSLELTDTITLDTVAPTGTFVIDEDAVSTADPVVSLDSSVSGATMMRFDMGGGFGDWTAYAASSSGTLIGGDGLRTVTAEYKDAADNPLELSDTITLDTVAPTGSFAVNGGSVITSSAVVSLDSSVSGATMMRLVMGGGFGDWTAYTASSSGTLVGADGLRTVTAQYKDDAGNSLELSDTVVLDTTSPAAPTGMLVGASGNGVVAVEWSPAPDPDVAAQVLQRAVGTSGTWTTHATLSSTASGYTDSSLINGTTYRYRVYAVDALGNTGPYSAEASAIPDVTVYRAAGTSRYDTAIQVSKSAFSSADTVVLATGQDFPDALGAAGLAGCLDAPVLLTPSGVLPGGLLDEIDRLGAHNVVIVGGTLAVTADVAEALADHGLSVRRISGGNRYATAAAVAAEVIDMSGATDVLIARGDGFADAFAAGPLAYSAKLPMLLVSATAVPWDTEHAIARSGISKAVVLGGEFAVPAAVANALGVVYDRAGSTDRYGTAVVVAEYGVVRGWVTWDAVGLATGAQFPDALGGGAALGRNSGVLLLTRAELLPQATRTALEGHATLTDQVLIMGGEFAVSAEVLGEVRTILGVQ